MHGAGGSSSIWYKQLRAFKENFNVLLIDLRGHGKSKKPIYENLKKYKQNNMETICNGKTTGFGTFSLFSLHFPFGAF